MSRALALLLPVVLLTGCAPSAEEVYLSMVRDSTAPLEEVVPDEDLRELGRSFCLGLEADGFEDGMTMAIFISGLELAGVSADNFGEIVEAAIAAYCPEYSYFFE